MTGLTVLRMHADCERGRQSSGTWRNMVLKWWPRENDKNVDHQDAVVIDKDSTIRIWSLVFGTYITFVSCKGELRLYKDDQWKNSTILRIDLVWVSGDQGRIVTARQVNRILSRCILSVFRYCSAPTRRWGRSLYLEIQYNVYVSENSKFLEENRFQNGLKLSSARIR